MKNKIKTKILLCSLLLLLISFRASALVSDSTKIVCGTATLTGKITVPENMKNDSIYLTLTVTHLITGEYVKYNTTVNKLGEFSLKVNVETEFTPMAGLNISIDPDKYLFVQLKNEETTRLDIEYDANNQIKTVATNYSLNKHDIKYGFDAVGNMLMYEKSGSPQSFYDKPIDYFINYVKLDLSERLSVVRKDSLFSQNFKNLLIKNFTLIVYSSSLFDYEETMKQDFQRTNKEGSIIPVFQKIDKNYFQFLKELDLNNPVYLQCGSFLEFQKALLQNETLNIPKIEDTDIPTWLKQVKGFMANLVGFSEGQYYDVLAANAYARQMNEEVRPLSEKQIQNIQSYWKEGAIAKILFRKNKEIAAIAQLKTPAVINDVSNIAPDKVIENILAKYPNKVVFIDLWATWCAPCLQAMTEFRSTKNEFHGKDVVFVYLSNPTSPRKLWEEKIIGIGSEQYYLNNEQWEHVMSQFDFEYIPSYLIFDQKGTFKYKHSAFPGNDKLKAEINGLL